LAECSLVKRMQTANQYMKEAFKVSSLWNRIYILGSSGS
jgi:hypothetical protein